MLGRAGEQVRQTLDCTAVGATLCTVLGATLADRWIRCRRTGRTTLVPLVLLNLTVPASLLALGTIRLTARGPLAMPADSAWPLILCYVARLLPLATLAFYAAWRNVSPLPELAAGLHGVAGWRRALRVSGPPRAAAVTAVAALAAILMITDLEMSLLLQATGRATLGVRLSTLIHKAPRWMPSALTLGIIAITLPGIAALVLLRRVARAGRPGRRRPRAAGQRRGEP